jgi:hypothetical protein
MVFDLMLIGLAIAVEPFPLTAAGLAIFLQP